MKFRQTRRFLACFLAQAMVLSLGTGTVLAEEQQVTAKDTDTSIDTDEKQFVVEYFQDPDSDSKPMARMWFPDAGAGEDDDDLIEKQIMELADKGFSGVEVAMLADGVSYNNEEGRIYGWGSENWSILLKKVLKAAAKVDGGFQVDMTITAHWPPSLNTLDPNDDSASKQLSYSITELSADALENGGIAITLPEQQTGGPANAFSGAVAYEGFLFTDTFISAAVVQVSDVEAAAEEGGDPVYVFDYSTITPITDNVSIVSDGGYAAGIPDAETCEKYGWDYDAICEFFGPEAAEGTEGKLDEDGNRKRMADWQDEYKADLNGINVEAGEANGEIEAGDWVILSTFYRGTGQTISGGRIMHNGTFVTSYFNEEGTSAITDYWDQMFADDPELLELMKANPGYIFEDSIESSSTSSYWASGLDKDIAEDYEYGDILALVAASRYTGSGFGGTTLNEFYKFSGAENLTDRIYEDYNDLLAETYIKYRVEGVENWASETIGWGFRGQTYHLPGLEIASAASVVDIAECDNMSKGDGVRYQAGTVNITGRDQLTMEAITGPTSGFITMDSVISELGQNYSDGVSRAILHGTPYAKTFNGYNSEWPGWIEFGVGSFGSGYTYRQIYWDDITTETAYMSRIQSIIQKGTAQIDLAVLIDKTTTYDFESGNRFQNLLDMGYSYNLVSDSTILHENAYVEDGILAPDGPAYSGLIVDRVNIISTEAADRLLEYAQAGLPTIVYNSTFERVYGSAVEDDAKLAEIFETLQTMENVKVVSEVDKIPAALEELGVTSHSSYEVSQLETTLYTDKADGTNYYYMFNNAYPENSGMMGNAQGENYKGEDKAIFSAKVTLEGSGVPYKLDTLTGEISQVGEYTINDDGTVTFVVDQLYGGDSVVYAISENTECFPAEAAHVTSVDASDYTIVREDNGLALRTNTAGTYKVSLSDGTETDVTVENELEILDLTDEDWALTIDSYSPDDSSSDPSDSTITTIDMGTQKLGKWSEIEVTEEQLAEFGVEDMRNVSGTGYYSITFTAPENWDEDTGAYLDVTYGQDQIGSITVNGTTLIANNATDRVDLSGLLVTGENTIEIKLNSTIYGRMYVENSGYEGSDFGMGTGFMAEADPDAYYNGLLSVTLTPYTQVTIQ